MSPGHDRLGRCVGGESVAGALRLTERLSSEGRLVLAVDDINPALP